MKTETKPQTREDRICSTSFALGIGSGFVAAALTWLSVFAIDVMGICTIKDIPVANQGGFAFCFIVGGGMLGIGVACLVGGLYYHYMELKFELANLQLERERSIDRLLN